MEYTYVAGVLLLLFFAAMFVTERMWGKEGKSSNTASRGSAPAPAPRPQSADRKAAGGKKGRKG